MSESYGTEIIMDLHHCPSPVIREQITQFVDEVCSEHGMQKCEFHWWDDQGVPEAEKQTEPHLKGTSAVQFIMTSSIVIHTLDLLGKVFINVFSCGSLDQEIVRRLATENFGGRIVSCHEIVRT